MGKKSTAQPRPTVHVPPKGIGPISEPNENDVLCGRGGRINAHEGNVQFRDIVTGHKKVYLAKTTKKLEKAHIAARIVEQIRTMSPPGRFLKEDSATGMWWDIGDAKAIKKAGQALREDAPDIRDGSGDEDGENGDTVKKTSPKTVSVKKVNSSPPNKRAAPVISSAAATATAASSRGGVDQHRPLISLGTTSTNKQRNLSWHSTGSSSFGMPFPNQPGGFPTQQQAMPAPPVSAAQPFASRPTNSATFPSTASVGSAGMHSLSSGRTPTMQSNLYAMPNQLYQGMRGAGRQAGTLSKRAAEMMHMQVPQQQQGGAALRRPRDPNELFGRVFTPTEVSSGSTISTMSGMSGYSNTGSNLAGSNLAGSQFGAVSALSLGSSGLGPPILPGNSLRMSQISNAINNRRSSSQTRASGLSDITHSFMSSSGLTRSPSFGDLPASITAPSMSDSSFVALMAEEKEVGDAFLASNQQGNNSSSRSSAASRTRLASSNMSVTSICSDDKSAMTYSMKSVGSNNSWLQPFHQKRGAEDWMADDRSLMSDVSESISALDLAAPAAIHHF